MSVARKLFLDLPVARKLVVILWLFLVIVVCLLGLSYVTIENLSAARAYVGGEGLWSKAQKQAVYDLLQYSISHSEQTTKTISMPYWCLWVTGKPAWNWRSPFPTWLLSAAVSSRAAIVPRTSKEWRLFRRFRHSRYMSEAVDIWAQGDALIEQLQKLGNDLHAEISSGSRILRESRRSRARWTLVGKQLTPLEDRFSYALGAGARHAKGSFLLVTFVATAMSLIAGLLFTFFMLRHVRQTEERYKHLIETANDAILVLDAETGIILEANEKSSALLGRPRREIVGIRRRADCSGKRPAECTGSVERHLEGARSPEGITTESLRRARDRRRSQYEPDGVRRKKNRSGYFSGHHGTPTSRRRSAAGAENGGGRPIGRAESLTISIIF